MLFDKCPTLKLGLTKNNCDDCGTYVHGHSDRWEQCVHCGKDSIENYNHEASFTALWALTKRVNLLFLSQKTHVLI